MGLEVEAVRLDQPDMTVEARALTFGVYATAGLLLILARPHLTGPTGKLSLTGSSGNTLASELPRDQLWPSFDMAAWMACQIRSGVARMYTL